MDGNSVTEIDTSRLRTYVVTYCDRHCATHDHRDGHLLSRIQRCGATGELSTFTATVANATSSSRQRDRQHDRVLVVHIQVEQPGRSFPSYERHVRGEHRGQEAVVRGSGDQNCSLFS